MHNASFPDAADAMDRNVSCSTDCATHVCDMPCSECRASHSFACRALSCIGCASTRTCRCLATRTLRLCNNCAIPSTKSEDGSFAATHIMSCWSLQTCCSGATATTHMSARMLWACTLMFRSPTLDAVCVAVGEGGGAPRASAMAGIEVSIGMLWACIVLFLSPTLDAPCVARGGGAHLVPVPWLAPRCQKVCFGHPMSCQGLKPLSVGRHTTTCVVPSDRFACACTTKRSLLVDWGWAHALH